ncbi:signal peptide, CUB and EGF-like domain-containing protein 3 [Penaeus monodon]|uniref:signal peptide, CUB and EGF-like domain-containing protein 3 n=1 Tax=Penaeus monodon TaxID=6687 RepID=UPI0018A7BA5D|nr:signal peptide, CUB and EGF-like domain-containing protein 3 [Penaeus monodon]
MNIMTDIDECSVNNGGCDDICINTPGLFSCSCSSGYMLHMDGRSCTDVDECKENSKICNGGVCSNTPGAYVCTCEGGLIPDSDGPGCLGRGTGCFSGSSGKKILVESILSGFQEGNELHL